MDSNMTNEGQVLTRGKSLSRNGYTTICPESFII